MSHRRTLLREAQAIIDAEYAMPLALDDIAHQIATSRRQLQRCFAELAGTSFRTYVRRVRMTRAAELLLESDLPVATVARRVGYEEAGQFAKAFRSEFGVVPSEYRAKVPTQRLVPA